MAGHKNCNCWTEDDKRCKNPLFIFLKVQVFHPNSLRKSWQTWYLCEDCFQRFMKSNGKDWGCKYRNDKKAFAPLIQYKIF